MPSHRTFGAWMNDSAILRLSRHLARVKRVTQLHPCLSVAVDPYVDRVFRTFGAASVNGCDECDNH
jgi:hypothetical protein